MAEKWRGTLPLFGEGELGPPSSTGARAEAYLHAKLHLDPSNRLATIHQRHRQTGHDTQWSDSIGHAIGPLSV